MQLSAKALLRPFNADEETVAVTPATPPNDEDSQFDFGGIDLDNDEDEDDDDLISGGMEDDNDEDEDPFAALDDKEKQALLENTVGVRLTLTKVRP